MSRLHKQTRFRTQVSKRGRPCQCSAPIQMGGLAAIHKLLKILSSKAPMAVDVHWMKPSGAAVFGWPLVWALPMTAYRALGHGLSKHVAWDFGVALSLAAVAATVVAVGYLGRHATGRRSLGLLAAALWTAWPLLVALIA